MSLYLRSYKNWTIIICALTMSACFFEEKTSSSGAPSVSMSVHVSPVSSAYTAASWAAQPSYAFYNSGTSSILSSYSDNVSLRAYSNAGCSGAASGTLALAVNPVGVFGGVASFSGASYTLGSALEETISIKGSAQGSGLSICSASIDILHYFNLGSGYTLFQAGGTGAAGAANATKLDQSFLQDGLQIDSNGRYVLFGQSKNGAGGVELTIWRYNPNGSIDTTFGNGATAGTGYVLFQAGGVGAAGRVNATKIDIPRGSIIDSAGRYVIVGNSKNAAGGLEMTIWRYNADGSIDTTFGSGATAGLGYVLFNAGGTSAAGAPNATKYDGTVRMLIDSAGRYVIVGVSINAAGAAAYEAVIWRYNTDGSIDTTFGNGATAGLGYVVFQNGGNSAAGALVAVKQDFPLAFAIDSAGRYVIGGNSRNAAGRLELVIWRYNADGSLDSTFGNGATAGLGYVLFNAAGVGTAGALNAAKSDSIYNLVIDGYGRYVCNGRSLNGAGGYEVVHWRYNADGSLDTTFGNGATAGLGYVLFNAGGTSVAGRANATKIEFPYNLRLDSLGRYVVGGMSRNVAGGYEGMVMRYNIDGSLDTTFGGGGTGYSLLNHDVAGIAGAANATKTDYVISMQVDRFNRIVASGTSKNAAGGSELLLMRWKSDGTLDF